MALTINIFAQELRGVWFARDSIGTKDAIARAMDSLASNNFNVVYVDVWTRGYPLWQSSVFYNQTGLKTDPAYSTRDILAECIAEGHRRGLLVEAWFEYGFVGGYSAYQAGTSGKGKIFDTHPDWVEKQQSGSEIDGSNFYWMSHTNKAAQDFLISLCAELARNYDVDGIEMDRCRYSSLSYGYDTYTDSLYQVENGGSSPPSTTTDTTWIRWRANKLNDFVARLYDSLKTVNSHLNVSNAPSHYSASSYSAYTTYCQDWAWWVNHNKVDNVNVQCYVASPVTFGGYIGYMKTMLDDYTKAYPSFALKPNSTSLTTTQLLGLIDTTRSRGYLGNGIWYYSQIFPFTALLKSTRYATATYPPYSTSTWRSYKNIVLGSDTANAQRTGTWSSSASAGYSGNSLYAASGTTASIDYYATVPLAAQYEVYAYQVISSNRSTAAPYKLYNASGGTTSVPVNQTTSVNKGWYKLGDVQLNSGKQKVLTISNSGITSGTYVSADAVMIILNRRLSPNADSPLPVELQAFNAQVNGASVELSWSTATEVNTCAFIVERKKEDSSLWENIASIVAAGNSSSQRNYDFTDKNLASSTYSYRLKIVDNDGSYTYSSTQQCTLSGIEKFSLAQNYPNPFNPSTVINYSIGKTGNVVLKVYDVLGNEVCTLLNESKPAGEYTVEFNGADLASGIYYYRLSSQESVAIKKMILLK
jgi:uncharacterized lipoprotein YddW (UPF0748 family)